MKLKKIVAALTAGALALGAMGVVVGCGPDNETVIREAIVKEFDTYKNMDDSALSEIATFAEQEGLDELGIDGQEFATAVLDGFDYTVDSVTVNGKDAVAKVTIVSKSYSDFEDKFNAIIDEMTNDPSLAEMSEEEAVAAVGEKVMQVLDETETITESADVAYVLKGNVWEPAEGDKALANLDSLIFAQ